MSEAPPPATPGAPGVVPSPSPDPSIANRPRLADQIAQGEAAGAAEADLSGKGARDLPNELSRAFGTPTRCFPSHYVTSNPGTLTVTLRVRLDREGRVLEGSALAPGAPEEVRRCLDEQVRAVRLPSPIPEAPRRVETSVEFELSSSPLPQPATGAAGALPSPGARQPQGAELRQRLEALGAVGQRPQPDPSDYQLPPQRLEGGR